MGFKLINATDGGEGVLNPNLETRDKMYIAKINKKICENY